MYDVCFSKRGKSDYKKVLKSEYYVRVKRLISLLQEYPYIFPPFFEQYTCRNTYSRRINQQHRLVYRVNEEEKTIEILSCWTHYHD